MGQCCCSRILGLAAETGENHNAAGEAPAHAPIECHRISASMSAPTIRSSDGGSQADGSGLALADVIIDQDSAYWEWHVTISPAAEAGTAGKKSDDGDGADPTPVPPAAGASSEGDESGGGDGADLTPSAMMFGLSTKRNAKFYKELSDSSGPSHKHGTKFMSAVADLADGEHTIGVAVQQIDLPMIQIFVDGAARDDLSILKFRGNVYPSVFLPPDRPGSCATFVHLEDQFRQKPPQERFGPIIAARGMI